MAQYTLSQIVTAALQQAGNTSLTALAKGWFNEEYLSICGDMPWPFLKRRSVVALAAGSNPLAFGNGSPVAITNQVRRILDPIKIYTSDYATKGLVRLQTLVNSNIVDDESLADPTKYTGLPTLVKARQDTALNGKFSLYFDPIPDKAYNLAIDYLIIPAKLSTTGSDDTTIPVYYNDRTLIQAVFVRALRYMKKYDEWAAEKEILSAQKIDDRVKYGSDDDSEVLGLDSRVHRSGQNNGGWPR